MRPTGWFQVAWSADLEVGDVKPLHYFGAELVTFRDLDSIVRVLDAHCQHMGADLSHGGCVVEGGIQCPFHGWVWSGDDGRNVRIPYEPHADGASRVRCWPTAEFNECTYVWHDLQYRAPLWPAPDAWGGLEDRIGSHWFRPVGPDEKQFFAGVTVHPQVVAESSVDRQHYQFVHKVPVSPRVLAATADASSWHTTIGFGGGNPVEICWHGIGLSFSFDDIDIWAHLRYLDRAAPAPSEADDFRQMREWARGFYPPAQPDLRSVTL